MGSFAGLAALLAAIGIYGVLSYLVTQRTREIGIRMSLGASRQRVLGDLLREGMTLALAGVVVGAGGAYAAGKLLASLLHEVKPGDPTIFVATALLLASVALVACYVPARRAAKLDPMKALTLRVGTACLRARLSILLSRDRKGAVPSEVSPAAKSPSSANPLQRVLK